MVFLRLSHWYPAGNGDNQTLTERSAGRDGSELNKTSPNPGEASCQPFPEKKLTQDGSAIPNEQGINRARKRLDFSTETDREVGPETRVAVEVAPALNTVDDQVVNSENADASGEGVVQVPVEAINDFDSMAIDDLGGDIGNAIGDSTEVKDLGPQLISNSDNNVGPQLANGDATSPPQKGEVNGLGWIFKFIFPAYLGLFMIFSEGASIGRRQNWCNLPKYTLSKKIGKHLMKV